MATTEVLFNPLLPEFHADPYPFYRRLREQDPVHQSPLGFWVLTRYEDCVMALRDQRFGREAFAQLLTDVYGDGTETGALPRSMLFRDPPDHTRLRALVSKAFTPRVIDQMREHIQEIVDRLLDRVQSTGEMDVIGDLAYPLPVTVICEMLGVPLGDHESIRGWSADIARSLDAIGLPSDAAIVERGRVARRAIGDYFRALVPRRRGNPQNDLLTGLIAAEEQGDKLSEGEVIAMCVLLFIAGHETTVNLIGNGTMALLRNRDQLDRLRADPALDHNAIEELLRYDSPVTFTQRITLADYQVGDVTIPPRQQIITILAAANRDPAAFADPDRLDLGRAEAGRHVAFGGGHHFCLGAALARLEGEVAIPTLVRRFPALELDGDPMRRDTFTLRGLERLPVRFAG